MGLLLGLELCVPTYLKPKYVCTPPYSLSLDDALLDSPGQEADVSIGDLEAILTEISVPTQTRLKDKEKELTATYTFDRAYPPIGRWRRPS
jgi:hypothetical protein